MIARTIKPAYNRFIRPWLPHKIGVWNGIPVRSVKLLDVSTVHPEYEAESCRALRREVRRDDAVVVLGGGIGVTTTIAAQLVGKKGTVTTYEPNPDRAAFVRETVALSRVADRVEVVEAAVGRVNGKLGLESVATSDPSDLPNPDILEIDIEGSETEVLPALTCDPRVIIVEYHGMFGASREDIEAALSSKGYSVEHEGVLNPEGDVGVLVGECER